MPATTPTQPKSIPFTASAYQELKDKWQRLTTEREEVKKRLAIAREQGDLSENGAYKYAKIELGDIGRELRRLRHLLDQGYVSDRTAQVGVIGFGATITLQLGAKTRPYLLVSQHESNPAAGKLSLESPLGQALLGKKVGEIVTVQAPAGETRYTIVAVE
jgi:transcription elongation GreA/GreB family factor